MKLDFYAPKNYYGSHILAFGGWITFLSFLLIFPTGKDYSGTGAGMIYGITSLIPIDFLLIAILFYLLQTFFKTKAKNQFLLKNKTYDYFFDTGIILIFTPIFWYDIIFFKFTTIFIIFIIFAVIRILKSLQNKSEKRDINET